MTDKRAVHRSITERWVVTGKLVLETPAHFGNGDADPLVDMPLLMDEATGRPLLPGTSIAGALRNYLRERELGYGEGEGKNSRAARLFGGSRGDDDGAQSPLIVYDSVCEKFGLELRDGVKIEAETRTAKDEAKFDLQLLAAGSEFPLCFELAVSGGDGQELRNILATALDGLKADGITLGARKRRGFGQVSVKNWQVWKYDLREKSGLLAWLSSDPEKPVPAGKQGKGSLAENLGATLIDEDKRKTARLTAVFTVDGTLMIRSGFGESDSGPDMVHLHRPRAKEEGRVPVIPGTSWAGILRHRALKIARTVSGDNREASQAFVDGMFGPSVIERGEKNAKASRVSIREAEITDVDSLVVTRVKIDRFTGGAFESALFTEQPAVGKPETRVTLDLTLRNPANSEIGLLLLLLKDLWTGDLPIGGESGVGRGRLKGVEATLKTPAGEWTFEQKGDHLIVPPKAETLETWVDEFNQVMKKAQVQA